MTTGREGRQMFFFALPLLLGSFIQHLYNVTDGIILGNFLGVYALSAVGATAAMVMLFLGFATGLSVGAGIIISQKFGAKKLEDMPKYVSTMLILIAGIGVITFALSYTLAPVILRGILQVPGDIYYLSLIYFRIFSVGIIFQFVYNGIAMILRAIGDAKVTLYILALSSVINVLLTLFAVVVLGFGVAGAAVTTVISKLIVLIFSYLYMVKRYSYLRPRPVFDGEVCKLTLKVSLPIAIQHSVLSFAHIFLARLVNSFGVISIAGFNVAMRIEGFAIIPIHSLSSSVTTFAGQNVGAKKYERVKSGIKFSMIMSMAFCAVITTVLMIFASPLARAFGLSGEALTRSVEQIRFMSPFIILLCTSIVISGALKGCGDIKFPVVTSVIALAVRIVSAYALVHYGLLGYSAAWVTAPFGWGLMLLLLILRTAGGKWKKKSVG